MPLYIMAMLILASFGFWIWALGTFAVSNLTAMITTFVVIAICGALIWMAGKVLERYEDKLFCECKSGWYIILFLLMVFLAIDLSKTVFSQLYTASFNVGLGHLYSLEPSHAKYMDFKDYEWLAFVITAIVPALVFAYPFLHIKNFWISVLILMPLVMLLSAPILGYLTAMMPFFAIFGLILFIVAVFGGGYTLVVVIFEK